jgi:hypothetical protein
LRPLTRASSASARSDEPRVSARQVRADMRGRADALPTHLGAAERTQPASKTASLEHLVLAASGAVLHVQLSYTHASERCRCSISSRGCTLAHVWRNPSVSGRHRRSFLNQSSKMVLRFCCAAALQGEALYTTYAASFKPLSGDATRHRDRGHCTHIVHLPSFARERLALLYTELRC